MTSHVEAYNLVRPETLAHPYPLYDELRRHSPVHWSEGLRAWILSCYDDVIAARPAELRCESLMFYGFKSMPVVF